MGHSNLQGSQVAKVDSDAKEGAGPNRNDDQGPLMSNTQVNLMVLTYDEWQSWKYDCLYSEKWPGYDYASFVKASQASQKLDLTKYRRIRVSREAIVSEVIMEARKSIAGFDKDFWEPNESVKKKYPNFDYRITYSLYYPAINNERITDSTRISELGIVDADLVVILF